MNEKTLLADLRAAGIGPMRPDEIREVAARSAATHKADSPWPPTLAARLVAELLEARGRLAEVEKCATAVQTRELYCPLGCRNHDPAFLASLGSAWSAGHRAACWEILEALGWVEGVKP